MAQKFKVVDGPEKIELMFSLFDGNSTLPRTVHFTLDKSKKPLQVAITGIRQGNEGSCLRCWFKGTSYFGQLPVRISGYYDTVLRKGTTYILKLENHQWKPFGLDDLRKNSPIQSE